MLAFLGLGALCAQAATYSIDASGPLRFEDDLFNPGPGMAYSGSGAPGIEVNAMSYGRTGQIGSTIHFSVASGAVGAPNTAVNGEATGFTGAAGSIGDESADVFSSAGGGSNVQIWDGDGVVAFGGTPGAPAPPLGLAEPKADNVDAYDARTTAPSLPNLGASIFFSVDPATAAGPYGGSSSADIFMMPAIPGYSIPPSVPPPPYAAAAQLGLQLSDDIDALVYFEDGTPGPTAGDVVFFSLAPGSPTLAGLGASPADILSTSPGAGTPVPFMPASALGLTPGDDLNALDVVPEPTFSVLLVLALAAGCALRRRD